MDKPLVDPYTNSMRAAVIDRYGSGEKIRLSDVPIPPLGPNDILLKVRSASVNPIDFKVRDGKLRFLRSYDFPLILGHDCAGEIVEVGPLVDRFKTGERVYSRPRNGRIGTFAEFIAIDQNEVSKIPKNLSFDEAAALPLVGLTCWQALIDVAKMKAGHKVLIQAGSGGIGTFAIQLAKHFGAEVWTTTSGKNLEFVKSLGADHIINYQTEDFQKKIRGLDIVFDTLGGEALKKSFAIVRPGGWIVSISGSPDHKTAKDMNLGFLKTLVLRSIGYSLNARAKKVGISYRFIFMKSLGDELDKISELVEHGSVRPIVDRVFPLSDCQSALEYSESGRARGKIVVKVC